VRKGSLKERVTQNRAKSDRAKENVLQPNPGENPVQGKELEVRGVKANQERKEKTLEEGSSG